jgi:hypothetical protein
MGEMYGPIENRPTVITRGARLVCLGVVSGSARPCEDFGFTFVRPVLYTYNSNLAEVERRQDKMTKCRA